LVRLAKTVLNLLHQQGIVSYVTTISRSSSNSSMSRRLRLNPKYQQGSGGHDKAISSSSSLYL
jgi:hypothetical protein